MKNRVAVIIGMSAVLAALSIVGIRIASLKDVAVGEFRDAVDASGAVILVRQTTVPSDLPLMISLRFPDTDFGAGLGFPDRTERYTFESGQDRFDCHAHVRRDRVCFVTLDDGGSSKDFGAFLKAKFPKLSIK